MAAGGCWLGPVHDPVSSPKTVGWRAREIAYREHTIIVRRHGGKIGGGQMVASDKAFVDRLIAV
jgi:hypothetical protein